jgi:hypothetical protein
MKNMIKKLSVLILLAASVLSAGCFGEDETPTAPSAPANPSGNATGQPIPTVNAGNVNGVMATIQFGYALPIVIPGQPATSIDVKMGFAQFGAPGSSGVDAGNASVSGNTVGKVTQNGSTIYIAPNAQDPTSFTDGGLNLTFSNANAHQWTVAGGNGIPALNSLGTTSPNNFTINQPANNSTVNKSGGLTMQLSSGGAGDSVIVLVAPSADQGGAGSGTPVIRQGLSGNSITISGSELGNLSGPCIVQVARYRYRVTAVGGSNYVVIAEVVKTVNIRLQ